MIGERRRHRGLTLLELVVAIAVFALLGLGSYRMLSNVSDMYSRLTLRQTEFDKLTFSLDALSRDLSQSVPRSILDESDQREPAFVGTEATLSFTHGGWANHLKRKRSTLRRTSYSLGDSGQAFAFDEEQILTRRYWQVLDRTTNSSPIDEYLAPFQSLTFQYLDHEFKWHNQWPPLTDENQNNASVPIAVKIDAQSRAFGAFTKLIVMKR